MKLKIGKEYVTRNGLKVKIYDIAESGDYPVIAGILESNGISPNTYTKEGRLNITGISDLDIIGEWQEPLEFDWSCLPPWINEYIAMDEDGRWFAFSKKPTVSLERFGAEHGGEALLIRETYTPKNFKGTWDKSLFKNPNIK